MNDFLQSIRNGNYSKDNGNNVKPRYNTPNNNGQRPRRTYEPNGNYNNMRNGNERKFRPRTDMNGFNGEETASNTTTMTTIKETLVAILANQEAGLAFAERRAVAEERKADAFEFIAAHIGKLTGDSFVQNVKTVLTTHDDVEPDMTGEHVEETVNAAPVVKDDTGSDKSKDEILEIIAGMRREGATYNDIASHLAGLNLPTFSGRGKWHAQTIHRLCQAI